MSQTKPSPPKVRSRSRNIRLHLEEDNALKQLAQTLNQTPSRVIRSLIRQAVTGGPDFFDDGVLEIRTAHRQLAAFGRNLNQLARAANRGDVIGGDDVRRVVNAGIVQMEAVKELYLKAVRATMKRTVLPLYEEAGLRLPASQAAEDGAVTGRPARQPGRGLGRAARDPAGEPSR